MAIKKLFSQANESNEVYIELPLESSSTLMLMVAITVSANIYKKNEINAFDSYDLMALPFMPVTYDPLRMHNLNFLDYCVNGKFIIPIPELRIES